MGSIGPLLLLFSVAGGYLFLQFCHFFKHRWDALEWERNLFESALFGMALFVLVRLAVLGLETQPLFVGLRDRIHLWLPFAYVGTFLLAIALALLVGALINWRWPRQRAIRRAVERHCGGLLTLLQDAAVRGLPVSLTMNNRKVYIGFIVAPPSPKYPYTKILPTVSGHRDTDTLSLSLDTPYWHVYEDLRQRILRGEVVGLGVPDFGIVLPISHVCSANLFDGGAYERYFAPPTQTPNPQPARGT